MVDLNRPYAHPLNAAEAVKEEGALLSIYGVRFAVFGAVLLSIMANVLTLTGPLFMLQIYDRILPSRSVPTLVSLLSIVVVLFGFYALVEWLRARLSVRIGNLCEERVGWPVLSTMLGRDMSGPASRLDILRNLDTVRTFFSSPAPVALLDLPWLPAYLGLVFFLHPALGVLSIIGAALLTGLLLLNDFLSRHATRRALAFKAHRQRLASEAIDNVEAISSMGMNNALLERIWRVHGALSQADRQVSDTAAAFGSAIKGFRYLLQSALLGLGAYLVLRDELSAGLIIAVSILTARALVPIEQIVAQGRNLAVTLEAWRDLRTALAKPTPGYAALPLPTRELTVTQLAAGRDGAGAPIISGINFRLEAGDCLAIIGRTGSGKTTLGRALVGIHPARHGSIRLDGSSLENYEPTMIGQMIGYLPQHVGLLSGTVMENIARFDPDRNFDAVLAAARMAGIHELIAGLPDGYRTELGTGGFALSAGQSQRIGLSRALYKHPFLLVLDEPNSNLDVDGDLGLVNAIADARDRGQIVVVIAHRPSAIELANKVLYMHDRKQVAFGDRVEVLSRITRPPVAVSYGSLGPGDG